MFLLNDLCPVRLDLLVSTIPTVPTVSTIPTIPSSKGLGRPNRANLNQH